MTAYTVTGAKVFFFSTGFYSPYRTLAFLNGLLDPQTFGRTPWLGDQSNTRPEPKVKINKISLFSRTADEILKTRRDLSTINTFSKISFCEFGQM
jgi:hypothetical protein